MVDVNDMLSYADWVAMGTDPTEYNVDFRHIYPEINLINNKTCYIDTDRRWIKKEE